MAIDLILAGIALLVLVFLSTIESAYESLSEVSLRVMASEHEDDPRADFFREIMERRRRFELILILGTQLSIGAIAILVSSAIAGMGVKTHLVFAFVVVFLVVIVFRQLFPRMLTQNRPETVFWHLLPVFRVFYGLFSLFVAPVGAVLERTHRPEPEPEESAEEEDEAKEEIQAFIDVGEEEGIIEESEGELIQSIIEFGDTLVADVMRPRPQIVAIEATATIGDARELIVQSKYSRIPVYRDQIDHIEGVVYVRDLLAYCEPVKSSLPVTRCMRDAYFVPESKPIADLFKDMQKAKIQLAMVIDEYGGVAGLVTIEDIIEEILGEIEDEDRAPGDREIVQAEDGSYLIDASAEIRKVELLYGKEVEADDFTTVAGLMINELGHVPAVGEKLELKGLQFEVVSADRKRVNRVRLRLLDPGPAETK
jgi:CBS domain containing-hemolysin-like protein